MFLRKEKQVKVISAPLFFMSQSYFPETSIIKNGMKIAINLKIIQVFPLIT
jgi:hypothetical protein